VNMLGNAVESNTSRTGKSGTQQKTFMAGILSKTVANGVGIAIETNASPQRRPTEGERPSAMARTSTANSS
jgi:hypothetical protein